jgi:hypothetical protein
VTKLSESGDQDERKRGAEHKRHRRPRQPGGEVPAPASNAVPHDLGSEIGGEATSQRPGEPLGRQDADNP